MIICSFYFSQNFVRHHWVHRRRQEGKCKQCGKVSSPVAPRPSQRTPWPEVRGQAPGPMSECSQQFLAQGPLPLEGVSVVS